ncbi:paired immunoglobulin-like type 2 receptor alpha isoform X3 [Prionailurus viverrinus]|uniref:paired immunoglobulin-like type 2 receptor alpha isoform X3 n=1 Tax=Prionailurus viverrinus TaxID=61388 RepID=UPI001FF50937|nr:paired immunoglobulin-like type 2 receptor alpha isoform X3 [Prionailurus viverrinus]
MGPSLLLSLLLLPASLQAGSSKECNPNTDFGVNQPASLSAPEGGSTCISFSYFHCWELAKDPRLSTAVRRRDFHGEVIYNSTQRFIHKDYKNRISLDLREGQNSGTLCIRNLQKKDENRYFCRVQVETLRDGKQVWQSIPGTKLTITNDAAQATTKGTTTAATITADLNVVKDNGSSASSPLSVGAAVGVALAGVVLIIAVLGLIVFLRWKRSKGLQTKARTVAGESVQNTEEKYENIGITDDLTPQGPRASLCPG